jgi:hypothetical protein
MPGTVSRERRLSILKLTPNLESVATAFSLAEGEEWQEKMREGSEGEGESDQIS